eukprot:6575470-Prymnesium_polylepis.1
MLLSLTFVVSTAALHAMRLPHEHARSSPVRSSPVSMQVGMTGGDLEGGRDESRNTDVTSLKRLFYREDDPNEDDERAVIRAAIYAHVGLHANLPLARFKMVLMPHQQSAFNIFQPSLVHLFETLLATSRPWLFATAQLPGGVDNLGNPEYALPGLGGDSGDAESPGPSATLQGTLSEVVYARRMSDARLYLIVHCLRRSIVVRGTQALPFSRADVLSLPDSEQLSAAARTVARRAAVSDKGLQQSAILAAAAAEDRCWRPYEFAPVSRDGPAGREFAPGAADVPTFASFAPSSAAECARDASQALDGARRAADALTDAEVVNTEAMQAMVEATRAAEAAEAAGAAGAAVDAVGAFGCCDVMQAALTLAEVEAVAAAGEGETAMATAEREVWLELDAFLRSVAARNGGAMPAPAQLLSLLPPPPLADGGYVAPGTTLPTKQRPWPEDFVLQRLADSLGEQAASQRSEGADPRHDPE